MTDWSRWGYDLGSSGFNAAQGNTGNISADIVDLGGDTGPKIALLAPLWNTAVLDGKIQTQCCVVGSFVYVTTRGGTFYKINLADGSVANTYAIGAPCSSTPHIIAGVAYFGDDAGFVHAVNTSTMVAAWKVQPGSGAAIMSHPVVSGTRVFIGDNDGALWALLISTGATSWSLDLSGEVSLGGTSAILGPLAVWSSHVYAATGLGVIEMPLAGGSSASNFYSARNQAWGVAIQTHPNGTDFLAFTSEDQHAYVYDRATGERLWMHGHQGGDMKCPVGLCLTPVGTFGTGFVILGTHNWSIQVLVGPGGDFIWKRDGTASAAVQAGFAIANGVFFGVWPPNDGRLVGFPFDQGRGGHTADFKAGAAGVDASPGSSNKFYLAPPVVVNDTVICGGDDKILRAYA